MEGALNAGTQTVFYGQGIWGLLMLAWFFCDGDKRDRTADLLNAIVRASWTQFEKMEISDKMDGFRP